MAGLRSFALILAASALPLAALAQQQNAQPSEQPRSAQPSAEQRNTQPPGTYEERLQAMSRLIPTQGRLGALAPENLNKERPEPPFDVTGTWFIDLSRAFSDFMFGPPYPEFIGQAKLDFEEGQRRRAAG